MATMVIKIGHFRAPTHCQCQRLLVWDP